MEITDTCEFCLFSFNPPNWVKRKCQVYLHINLSPPEQNGLHFADDIFRCIFVNDKFRIFIENSPNFIPKVPLRNNLTLV